MAKRAIPASSTCALTYRLTGPIELSLDMTARTDRPTMVNLTNHSFFNLDGARSGADILDHRLTVAADHFLAIDPDAIPLPEPPCAVAGTPFDFRNGLCGRCADSRRRSRSCAIGSGYDHNFCLAALAANSRFAARLEARAPAACSNS